MDCEKKSLTPSFRHDLKMMMVISCGTLLIQTGIIYDQILLHRKSVINNTPPCRWGLKYPNYKTVLIITPDWIWWWDSSSIVLRYVEYSFLSITPMPTLTQSSRNCCLKVISIGLEYVKLYSTIFIIIHIICIKFLILCNSA